MEAFLLHMTAHIYEIDAIYTLMCTDTYSCNQVRWVIENLAYLAL